MSLIFASERQRQMHMMKQRRLKGILQYNLQEIQRKRRQKEQQHHRLQSSYQTITSQALDSLAQQKRKRSMQREVERGMLRDCYDRQIRAREQKLRMDRARDKDYYVRQQEYMQFEEGRRMLELQKMFNRVSYQGVPVNGHRRVQTEPEEQDGIYNPQSGTVHLPSLSKRQDDREMSFAGDGGQSKVSLPPPIFKPTLDNIRVESVQKPRRTTPRYLG